ncbi:hypothetical protein ACINK0_11420 [Deinococcus sp. VB343]|uniref:hypothetical protein n=1 Tax=Deinococcus sp. VB343 TaxID=3385567 RepID=UPI0039C8CF9E
MKHALDYHKQEIVYLTGSENTAKMRRNGVVYVHPETFEKMIPCGGEGTAFEAFFRLERGSDARLQTLNQQARANRQYSK